MNPLNPGEPSQALPAPNGAAYAVPKNISKPSGGSESNQDWGETPVNVQQESRRRSARVQPEPPPLLDQLLAGEQLMPEQLMQVLALLLGRG